jgi:hypothetical protein
MTIVFVLILGDDGSRASPGRATERERERERREERGERRRPGEKCAI